MQREAKAAVTPVRQRTQYSCMAASMAMCLRALDHDVTEDEVNNVMGARPMKGAAWEQALATAQHYGCRATLTMPATVEQLKAWTDRGVPVMIAWNPEGRDWSHASVVFDVDDDLNVYVADPNIPNPKETVRVVSEDDFYHKWFEKFPDYLVRRPACAIEREVTPEGAQVAPTKTASVKTAGVDRQASQWERRQLERAAPSQRRLLREWEALDRPPKAPRVKKPPAVKVVVDSAIAEKLRILKDLATKVTGADQALIHRAIGTYEKGSKPSDDDLKAIRNKLYQNRMKSEADHFRMASGTDDMCVSVKRLRSGDVVVNAGPHCAQSAMRLLERAGWDKRLIQNVAGSWILAKELVPSIDVLMKALAGVDAVLLKTATKSSKWDRVRPSPFGWATPAANIDGTIPIPWRVAHARVALTWLKSEFPQNKDIVTDYHQEYRGRMSIWVGLRDNRDRRAHAARLTEMVASLRKRGFPVILDQDHRYFLLVDDLDKNVLRGKFAKGKGTKPSEKEHAVRDPFSRARAEQGGGGQGRHRNKEDYARGHARRPKHKNQEREAVTRLAHGFLRMAIHTRIAVIEWHRAAQKLLDENKGMTQDDLHYRGYLRAILSGDQAASAHFAKQFKGSQRARVDLIDLAGKGKFGAYKHTASVSGEEEYFLASDGQWYLEYTLYAENENEDEDDGYSDDEGETTYYGPFSSEKEAHEYQRRNLSNTGAFSVDKSGRRKPPRKPTRRRGAYSGNPDGKPIYDVKVDHGEHQALSGGTDVMKRLQDRYRVEQGHPPRDGNPQLNNETAPAHTASVPEMILKGRFLKVNQAFADNIQKMYRGSILKGSPRGGFTLIHPESDANPEFDGNSNYDFYFRPSQDGMWDVGYTPGYLSLLQKDGDKMRAKTTRMAAMVGKIDRKTRTEANRELVRAGLDGNGRFRKPEHAYSKAIDVIGNYGIELDDIVSSHLFQARPSGTIVVHLAFSNDEDPFSPMSIGNSTLYLQFTELSPGKFEAVAYLS